MATLVATIGASNANSYITLADAELYFETRLYKTEWEDAATSDKEMALMWATRLLDVNVDWLGDPAVPGTQALQWPRVNLSDRLGNSILATEMPDDIKSATCELALALLRSELTADLQQDAQGLKRLRAGPVEMEFKELLQSKVIPDAVWSYITHYGTILRPKSPVVKLLRA